MTMIWLAGTSTDPPISQYIPNYTPYSQIKHIPFYRKCQVCDGRISEFHSVMGIRRAKSFEIRFDL